MKYKTGVCGGTFDHFHKGHREFLHFVFSKVEKVVIGLTTDLFIESEKGKSKAKHTESILSYNQRKKELAHFLKNEGYTKRSYIVPINDIFGPTLSNKFVIDAILVTKDSLSGANSINKERQARGLNPFVVIVQKNLLEFDNEVISSSRIRKGEINREGVPFVNKLWLNKTLHLNPTTRKACKKPLGKVTSLVQSSDLPSITVGDISTLTFINNNCLPVISVVDLKVERKQIFSTIKDLPFKGDEKIIEVYNKPGTINHILFRAVLSAFLKVQNGKRVIILVNGEEDLTVLPIVLASPLGYSIYYGQPKRGMVRILVSEKTKEKVYRLLLKFSL